MFITSDEQLRTYIPNIVQTVQGETSLYGKMLPFLQSSERWVIDTFIGEELAQSIMEVAETKEESAERKEATGISYSSFLSLHTSLSRLTSLDAYIHAIPSLDLILTPNGFGVVSNNTVAPASKERVERLLAELETTRDNEINALLHALPKQEEWLTTEQATYFSSTLFPTLDICRQLQMTQHLWDNYVSLKPEILSIEYELEESCISRELMQVLHHDALTQCYTTPMHRQVIHSLHTYIIFELSHKQYENVAKPRNSHLLPDIVNLIRENPDSFPEWHDSHVASLFSPPLYENKKDASGYFF